MIYVQCIKSGVNAKKTNVTLDAAIVDSIISKCFEGDELDNNNSNNSVGVAMDIEDYVDQQNCPPPDISDSECNLSTPTPPFPFTQRTPSPLKDIAMHNLQNSLHSSSSYSLYTTSSVDNQKARQATPIKKKRKSSRARARPWSEEEQRRFEEGLELYGRNWEQCAKHVGTRRTSLVRSHAQKYLIKLWKLGKPLPEKVAETGSGYTLSGKPLHPESASAKSYLIKLSGPDPNNGSDSCGTSTHGSDVTPCSESLNAIRQGVKQAMKVEDSFYRSVGGNMK